MCQDCGCSLPRGDHHHHHQLQANPQLNDKKTLSVIHQKNQKKFLIRMMWKLHTIVPILKHKV